MSEWKRPGSPPLKRGDDHLFDFAQPAKSPDMTRAVMGRLGYMQVSTKVSRRHRLHRWVSRAGLTLAALLAVGVGLQMHNESSRARRPLDGNVPAALGNDLQQHRLRFDDVIQTIRRVTPTGPLQMPADLTPDEVDEDQGFPVDDDVQRLVSLPMRWV